MSGRAVEASGDVDVILLDKTGTITYGNRLAASITPAAGRHRGGGGRGRARRRRSATRRRRVARSSSSPASGWRSSAGRPASATTPASPALGETIVEEIAFRAETRTSGVKTTAGTTILKGAVDAIEKKVGALPDRGRRRGRPDRRPRGDAARPRERGPRPRRHRAQGHGQGGARRALRRVPPDGHPDRDDHRRQPADRGDDRQGGRRRRLHRAGHARGEDRVHPRRSRPRATSSR